ncbi:MAG: septum site-determining protein MinC [Vampirovibrionales bacterium]
MLQDTLASLQSVSSPVPHTVVPSGLAGLFPDTQLSSHLNSKDLKDSQNKGHQRLLSSFLANASYPQLSEEAHTPTLIPASLEIPTIFQRDSQENSTTSLQERSLNKLDEHAKAFTTLVLQPASPEEQSMQVHQLALQHHEVILVELAYAQHSLQALRALESVVASLPSVLEGLQTSQREAAPSVSKPLSVLHLQLGHLVLTRAVLQKMAQIAQEAHFPITMIYALVPQTQQAALQEGFAVKEKALVPSDILVWHPTVTTEQVASQSLEAEVSIPPSSEVSATQPDERPTVASVASPTVDPVSPEGFIVPELNLPRVNPEKLLPTLMLKQTLRSGQSVSYPGHVVIMGDVNAGAEIVAKGDVVVWGILKGMVHAGHEGDRDSMIRAHRIDALQIRIADILARRTQKGYALQSAGTSSLGSDSGQTTAFLTQVAEVQDQEIKIRISRI